jgi:hypothetical protein
MHAAVPAAKIITDEIALMVISLPHLIRGPKKKLMKSKSSLFWFFKPYALTTNAWSFAISARTALEEHLEQVLQSAAASGSNPPHVLTDGTPLAPTPTSMPPHPNP